LGVVVEGGAVLGAAEAGGAGVVSVGSGDGVVEAGRLAVLRQHAFTHLPAKHEPGLDHVRKHQNGTRLLAEQASRAVFRVETLERLRGVALQLLPAGGASARRSGHTPQRGGEENQEYQRDRFMRHHVCPLLAGGALWQEPGQTDNRRTQRYSGTRFHF
jgi:hypothetical protein